MEFFHRLEVAYARWQVVTYCLPHICPRAIGEEGVVELAGMTETFNPHNQGPTVTNASNKAVQTEQALLKWKLRLLS